MFFLIALLAAKHVVVLNLVPGSQFLLEHMHMAIQLYCTVDVANRELGTFALSETHRSQKNRTILWLHHGINSRLFKKFHTILERHKLSHLNFWLMTGQICKIVLEKMT